MNWDKYTNKEETIREKNIEGKHESLLRIGVGFNPRMRFNPAMYSKIASQLVHNYGMLVVTDEQPYINVSFISLCLICSQ